MLRRNTQKLFHEIFVFHSITKSEHGCVWLLFTRSLWTNCEYVNAAEALRALIHRSRWSAREREREGERSREDERHTFYKTFAWFIQYLYPNMTRKHELISSRHVDIQNKSYIDSMALVPNSFYSSVFLRFSIFRWLLVSFRAMCRRKSQTEGEKKKE